MINRDDYPQDRKWRDRGNGCNDHNNHLPGRKANAAEQVELISYLENLGVAECDLLRVMSLLQSNHGTPTPHAQYRKELLEAMTWDDLLHPTQPEDGFLDNPQPGQRRDITDGKSINLFIVEEHEILRNAYQTFFSSHPSIRMLGCSDDIPSKKLAELLKGFDPDVMLLGVKTLHKPTVAKLELIRQDCPELGLVLLFAFYDTPGIKALREFSAIPSAGRAYMLKHAIDSVEQLAEVVYAVADGRVIVDPLVMHGLVEPGDYNVQLLRELSPRELEVLSFIGKGYRNDTIADLMSCDIRTVERHVNSIYRKLNEDELLGSVASEDRRVRAALLYLRATGMLSKEQIIQH